MSTITVSLPSDGDTVDVADYNTPINTIVNKINGNIDSDNLKDGAVTTAKIADSNVTMPKIINPYKVRAFANTNQTINDNTSTTITFGTESYDTNNNFATNAYTVPITGYYQINAQITMTSIAKIASASLSILSDATVIGITQNAQGTALDSILTLDYADLVYLEANKVITAKALCDTSDGSTAAINGTAAGSNTFISISLQSV